MLVRSFARLSRFRADQRGNVAIIAGLVFMALIVIGGAAIDLHRAYTARTQGQDALDLAGVAAASTRHTDPTTLEQVAREYLDANAKMDVLEDDPEIDVSIQNASRIDMSLRGSVRTFFMGLIGINSLPVNVSTAVERGAVDRVELALVLDNTYSMESRDASGIRKIDALKSAARELVNALLTREDGSVKIGVVPYGDYVNVGLSRRNSSWLDVPADSMKTWQHENKAVEAGCRIDTPQKCTSGPKKTCTRPGRDGVPENYDCTERTCVPDPAKAKEVCWAAKPASYQTRYEYKKWHGCVGSRRQANSRLTDAGGQKYPGIMTTRSSADTTPNCVTEITPLTETKAVVTAALTAMITQRPNYWPSTYIPAGAIWGVNMLSPTEPLNEADDYQETHRDPRKIMVLMTDGANTMKFNSDGRHTGTTVATETEKTDDDTAAICTYAKSKGIEVYTVALAVDSDTARDLLAGCATSNAHYFDASDSQSLARAFADIAASIYRVRIVQ